MGSVESQTTLGQSFDPIALQEKYREERDKRIHNGGLSQYHSIEESSL